MKFARIILSLLIGLALLGMVQTPHQRVEAVTTTLLLGNIEANYGGVLYICQAPCTHQAGAVGFATPAASNFTVNQVTVRLYAIAPGYTASIALWSDVGGLPGVLISPIGSATLSAAGADDVVFDVNVALAPSTSYFLVVEGLSSVYGGWGFASPAVEYGVLTRGNHLRLSGSWVYDNGMGYAYELSYAVPDALASNAACSGTNLGIHLSDGDGPYTITGTGPGLPTTRPAEGTATLTGPGVWSNVTVTETGGDGQTVNLGTFSCTTNLAAVAACSGDNLTLNILAGDGPFTIGASLAPSLPATTVGLGTVTLPGPGTWTNLTVTESGGDLETAAIGTFTCSTTLLNVLPTCAGDNLLLNLVGGDGPFNITGIGPGLPLNGVGLGTITLLGPAVWSNITVTETTGNLQSFTLTSVGCKNYGIPVPNLGLVMITGEQFQPAYSKPNGAVARGSDGAEIWLPADADGNWYDTYVVAEVIEVDGEIWLGLFVGNVNWAYVRLADVTVIVPIQGVE